MSALRQWRVKLERLRLILGAPDAPATNKVIADRLKVHENSVLNWARSVPSVEHEPIIAELLGEAREGLGELLDAARQELHAIRLAEERERFELRLLARPTMGTAPAAVPSRKRTDARRRTRGRKLAAWLCTAASALSIGWGYGTAHAQPVEIKVEVVPLIGHRLRRWLWSGWRACPGTI